MIDIDNDSKSVRILDLFERLNSGKGANKKELVQKYGVSEKSIQRDIDEIRAYLSETYPNKDISVEYDRTKKTYYLRKKEREYLSCTEIMAISKIILESRAFNLHELNSILDKLVFQVSLNERTVIKDMIMTEREHYVPLQHGTPLIETIWIVSEYIKQQELITFSYTRQDGQGLDRTVKPVAIAFSEYYFYLIGYIEELEKDFPAVFRLDRCMNIKGVKRKFSVPYIDRFNLGEFRKRVQFMYSGTLTTVKFKFWGSSFESVLDRLPTARFIGKDGEKYIVEAEIFSSGIKMWLLSQMEFVEVLEPISLRDEMKQIINNLYKIYVS